MVNKKVDDTQLEWYGLTEEDLEQIKNEKDEIGDVNSKELLLASEIIEMFYLRFGVELDLDEVILFVRKNKLADKQFIEGVYRNEKVHS